MPNSYTYVSKPTGAPYSYVGFTGRQTYDQADLSYDDPSVFYDSVDMNAYTNISKPSDGSTIIAGMATGLIMPPTYTTRHVPTKWSYVNKPN